MGEVSGDDGFAAAISIIAIIITALIFMAQKHASNKLAFTMNALHPIEPKELKGVRGVLIHLYSYLVVGLSIVPQCYVIYTSFLKTEGLVFKDGYWLGSYRTAFSKMGSSIVNTFVIAGSALVVIILMAVLIAYLAVRRRNAATNTMDLISMMPYIIPGSVIGIAMLICFNRPPLIISGTFLIMIVALVIRRLPLHHKVQCGDFTADSHHHRGSVHQPWHLQDENLLCHHNSHDGQRDRVGSDLELGDDDHGVVHGDYSVYGQDENVDGVYLYGGNPGGTMESRRRFLRC